MEKNSRLYYPVNQLIQKLICFIFILLYFQRCELHSNFTFYLKLNNKIAHLADDRTIKHDSRTINIPGRIKRI